jgi:ATP-binding cassette, subfamily C, bacterial CydC
VVDIFNWQKIIGEQMKIFSRLLLLMKPFFGRVMLSIFLSSAAIASGIGLMGTSAYIIARAALQPSIAVLQIAIVGVRFFGISRGVLRYGERLLSHSVNLKLLSGLRTRFYQMLEPLAPARLKEYEGGDILSRAVADIDTLQEFYVRVIAPPITAAIITIGVGIFAGQFHRSLGWILVGGLTACGVLVPLFTYFTARVSNKVGIQIRSQLNTLLVESLEGMSDLLAFGAETQKKTKLKELSSRLAKSQMRQAWTSGFASAFNLIFMNLTVWLILWVAVGLVRSSQLEGVMLAVITLVTLSSFEAVNPLGQTGQLLEGSLEAGRRIFEITNAVPPVREPLNPEKIAANHLLSVCNLSFRYGSNLPLILDEINLEIDAGRRIALVGPSGAGKSTLIWLLLRFWDCTSGSINLNGIDIKHLNAEDVRKSVRVIPQSAYIFGNTVRQNLLLSKPGASEAECMHVLQQVQLEDWLKNLTHGLDTWIGENGLKISGGERQRLIIARCLLADSPLMVLDEPTANLDSFAAGAIRRTLMEAAKGKGVLWITHDLKGLEEVDEILVLNQGKIIERGTHSDLISLRHFYYRMCTLQRQYLSISAGTNTPPSPS